MEVWRGEGWRCGEVRDGGVERLYRYLRVGGMEVWRGEGWRCGEVRNGEGRKG